MKFGNTGRDITDKRKFMTNKPKGSFLERFKGRTVQLDKEGHLGIIKTTSMPIKVMQDDPSQAYTNQGATKPKKLRGLDTVRNMKPQNNFQALSPLKRSNSIAEDNIAKSNNRYESFARNYQKNQNPLTKSYNGSTGLRGGLANAGSNVLNSNLNNTMKNTNPKMRTSHLVAASPQANNFSMRGKNGGKAPNSSQNPKEAYSAMKVPAAMAASLKGPGDAINPGNVRKSSFYSEQKGSNYRKKFNISDIKEKSSYPMPYSNSSAAGNSDGFMNTAVSTPLYGTVSIF
jgi:hypothetical protein